MRSRRLLANWPVAIWKRRLNNSSLDSRSLSANSSSVNSDMPSPQLAPYAMTKAAIANFTASLAQMYADKGIRANSVAPGPIWTPLIPATMPPEKVESFGEQVPMGRPGQPAELAPAYVFLASAESSYVTATTLHVNGGMPTP